MPPGYRAWRMKREGTDSGGSPAVRAARWTGAAVVVILLLLYLATLMPGVGPTDSGEMIFSAWLPGIAHAPGFPLYTVAGWLWSHALPVGRIAWRLNLLSAVCGAAAGGLVYALALRTLRASGADGRDVTAHAVLAAAAGALALGIGRTVWSWSTIAEVYALNLALTAAILLLVVRWTGLPEPNQPPTPAAHKPRAKAKNVQRKTGHAPVAGATARIARWTNLPRRSAFARSAPACP